MRGNAAVWMFVVYLGLAACETPQATIDEVAGARDECVTNCIGNLGPISEPCAECVSLHAEECSTLGPDCDAQCSPAQPSEGEP